MNTKVLMLLSILITACSGTNKEADSSTTFVIRNMNNTSLENVFIKTDYWHSDTISVAGNSDGMIYRNKTSGEFHEGYSVVFGSDQQDYGYEEYTTTIPTSESFMISFHGDTVRIAAFHVN